jgi:tRNA(Arg) A34 adenosine deaminase TadA
MTKQPSRIEFILPDWISDYTGDHPVIMDIEGRMDFVIEASRLNVEKSTGGPFAAAVFERDNGRLISMGVNLVITLGASALHAEIIAMTLAQQQAGTYDLGAAHLPRHELVVSAEPCGMCIGALCWSGIARLVTGAAESDVRSIGFNEGPKPDDWHNALKARNIEVLSEINRGKAAEVLAEYVRRGGRIYNPR